MSDRLRLADLYDSYSVIINDFWRWPKPIFHARWDPGTRCDKTNLFGRQACGHAMPFRLAVQIARPCRKCFDG